MKSKSFFFRGSIRNSNVPLEVCVFFLCVFDGALTLGNHEHHPPKKKKNLRLQAT